MKLTIHRGTKEIGGSCVEVADGVPGIVPVRDSKVSDGDVLLVGAGAWATGVGAGFGFVCTGVTAGPPFWYKERITTAATSVWLVSSGFLSAS